jgi:hypothetical protein
MERWEYFLYRKLKKYELGKSLKPNLTMNKELIDLVAPVLESKESISTIKMGLHKMFALAMANIPENETDNFTAKQLQPAYLALCELLENVSNLEI